MMIMEYLSEYRASSTSSDWIVASAWTEGGSVRSLLWPRVHASEKYPFYLSSAGSTLLSLIYDTMCDLIRMTSDRRLAEAEGSRDEVERWSFDDITWLVFYKPTFLQATNHSCFITCLP